MSDTEQARRSSIEVLFGGVDITSSVEKYLISLTYTDNEEDATDDLQIKLQDREGVWLTKWLNTAIQAAAEQRSAAGNKNGEKTIVQYKVIAQSGASVHSRAGRAGVEYTQYGILSYGTVISVNSISDGWANFMYSGKNAYVKAEYLTPLYSEYSAAASSEGAASKGLTIQAIIKRHNWNSGGKTEVLDCGTFELDSVSASGPPAAVLIKGTSLSYSSTVRQMLKSKSWEHYVLSGIANEIADKNGMTCMYLCDSDPSYVRVEQYRMSDIAFLQKLCHDAGFSLKVSNNTVVIFDKEKFESLPTTRTIYRGKDGRYKKYSLATAENNCYTSCTVSYVNNGGQTISATVYADGIEAKDDKQRLKIHQKVSSVAEAEQLAEKMLRLHNKFEFTANLTFPGDPSLVAGITVELSGWGAWDGKYIISQSKHNVNHSGYTTQVTLRKAVKE